MTEWLLSSDQAWINKGEIVEAFVGQELLSYAKLFLKQQLYYWQGTTRTSQAEVDYVTTVKQTIVPVEVKSGPGSTLKSMHIFLESHSQSAHGIRFSTQNYSIYEKIYSYPLYAVSMGIRSDLVKICSEWK